MPGVAVARVIPRAWLTPAQVRRVIVHWTGGAYRVHAEELRYYHVVLQDDDALGVGDDVRPFRGLYTPGDNDVCVDREYAAHTRRCNTGSFGLAAGCMLDADPGGPYGLYPLTSLLWERLAQGAAEVCFRYRVPVTPRTVLQHGEVERRFGIIQHGKWDCCELPFRAHLPQEAVCDEFRRKVEWFLKRLEG